MGLMEGKRGIVFGLANNMSIAWGIAQQLKAQGAELAFTYLNESLEKRVRPLAESLGSKLILPCDVANDADIEKTFATVAEKWEKIDFVVHAVAFANRDDLKHSFSQTSREGFQLALDISAYSLVAVTRYAVPLLKDGGSIVTLTYLGAERAVPNYNVMGVAKAALEASVRYLAAELGEKGIRVNAISAGPIKTLAASGIANFKEKIRLMD
ncbi:MAG: enoyl-ACP reductase, partial [Desulfuromonadales bacterium]